MVSMSYQRNHVLCTKTVQFFPLFTFSLGKFRVSRSKSFMLQTCCFLVYRSTRMTSKSPLEMLVIYGGDFGSIFGAMGGLYATYYLAKSKFPLQPFLRYTTVFFLSTPSMAIGSELGKCCGQVIAVFAPFGVIYASSLFTAECFFSFQTWARSRKSLHSKPKGQ